MIGDRLRAMWGSWTGFWFTPADPTPLCFMRIVAGILTLYVHIAYSLDLEAFFGPNAWCGQKECNETRRELPHIRHPAEWIELDPLRAQRGDTEIFQMPEDRRTRELFREFLDRLLDQSNPARVLEFMKSIATAGEERDEVLRYVRTLPPDAAQRDERMKGYVEDTLSAEDKDALPKFFARQSTREARQNFATVLGEFYAVLPPESDDRDILVQLLIDTTARDWDELFRFTDRLGKLSREDRKTELDFQVRWGMARRAAYAVGMQTYSPWFHVQDLRVLWLIHGLHLIVILLFTLGMYTRVTSVATWLVGLSYINRAQPYLFGQDTMMTLCLFYLMMSPCGAKWSLDRWVLRKRALSRGATLPPVAPSISAGFVLRLFQIQFCLMYLSAGCAKLKGTSWWNGTALYGCMANSEFAPMHLSAYRGFMQWLCQHRAIWEVVNSASAAFTLLTEISFPFLVWTRMRPVMVAASLLLHTGIAILMGLSVFSLFMFCLVACFIPADAINWMFETAAPAPPKVA